jgi:hypothetical protein
VRPEGLGNLIKIIHFIGSERSILALIPTEAKRPGSEAGHAPPSRAVVKEDDVRLSPNYVSMA